MRTLDFKVEAQIIEGVGDFSNLVPGTSGYLTAAFKFSEEWNGCEKVASFYDRRGKEHAERIVNGKCVIPPEVLDYRYFKLKVTGVRSTYRIGTNTIKIVQGGV